MFGLYNHQQVSCGFSYDALPHGQYRIGKTPTFVSMNGAPGEATVASAAVRPETP
jgi:hypothetical protein